MTKAERAAQSKRISKAVETIEEVLIDFNEALSWTQRCELRDGKKVLEFALAFHKA